MKYSQEMYRENILEHYKNPLNKGDLDAATHTYQATNPLCGDDILMQVVVEGEIIREVKFKGGGCAISMAAASLLTESVKGHTLGDVKKMTKDNIMALLGIPISPVRLKCALLCLEAIQKALP
jgi:nitrogen fixation NifU-like protein